MADERKNPASEQTAETNSPRAQTRAPGARTDENPIQPTGNPPHPAVPEHGEGYPEVDTLAFDPEGRDWLTLTRRWIEQNPALAVVGAAACGLLIGRVIAAAIPEPEPQTFSEKVEQRARELAKQGRHTAADASEVAGRQLAIAAEALGEASKAVGEGARRGYGEAKDFGEFLADSVGKAVAERASKWLDSR